MVAMISLVAEGKEIGGLDGSGLASGMRLARVPCSLTAGVRMPCTQYLRRRMRLDFARPWDDNLINVQLITCLHVYKQLPKHPVHPSLVIHPKRQET
jgi:hypothetical protein